MVGFLVKVLLLFLLAMLVARAFWRLIAGIIVGASLPPPSARRPRNAVPERGQQMVRDPVCGTFLLPANALTTTERGGAVRYFCSETCRQRFKDKAPAR